MATNRKTLQRPPAKQPRPPEATRAFQGKLFDVWQWRQQLSGGSETTFEVVTRPDTVLVLPVIRSGTVLLARERQPGMKQMLRAIGGRVMTGELPEAAIRRELLEETGLEPGELRLWNAWQPLNKMDWAVYLFVAHNLSKNAAPTLEPGESLRTREISVSALLQRPASMGLDDQELLHHLFWAKADPTEMRRVRTLLTPKPNRS